MSYNVRLAHGCSQACSSRSARRGQPPHVPAAAHHLRRREALCSGRGGGGNGKSPALAPARLGSLRRPGNESSQLMDTRTLSVTGPWTACQAWGKRRGSCRLGHEGRNAELPHGNAELPDGHAELPHRSVGAAPQERGAANHSPTPWDLGPTGLPGSAERALAGRSDTSLLPAALPMAVRAAPSPALPRSPLPLILPPVEGSTLRQRSHPLTSARWVPGQGVTMTSLGCMSDGSRGCPGGTQGDGDIPGGHAGDSGG